MISFKTYHRIDDAWSGGVADWCRAAPAHVLGGGSAWLVTLSESHSNGIKHRLMQEGVTIAGVRFLYARALRRELCLRAGLEPPAFSREMLDILLHLHPAGPANPQPGEPRRDTGAALMALEDFSAAGWDTDRGLPQELLPAGASRWLPILQASGSWTPEVDRELSGTAGAPANASATANRQPLRICIFGWDAGFWPQFELLLAALRHADDAHLYLPLPRGASETIQQGWLTALEEAAGAQSTVCPSVGFPSAQGALAARLEGVDLDGLGPDALVEKPELIVGEDWSDVTPQAAAFVARWLIANEGDRSGARLAILAPGRSTSAVDLSRALAQAGIAIEDELGETPEPELGAQIQSALVNYYAEDCGAECLLALVSLLNEHAAAAWNAAGSPLRRVFPIHPIALRAALRAAFGDVQQRGAHALCEDAAFARSPVAGAVCELLAHLGRWPDALPWKEAMGRWEACVSGFGLSIEALEPAWSRWKQLPSGQQIATAFFLEKIGQLLETARSRGKPAAANRFARVVLTTLDGASGRPWGGALFLDSNDGVWPLYPPENPFLDDELRVRLNAWREQSHLARATARRGYLLTSSDRAQLEHFRFLEILENCSGPLAFAAPLRDSADPARELYPNEWALRCMVESNAAPGAGERWFERWRDAIRRVPQSRPSLAPAESSHLRSVFLRRRDPGVPFDDYHFNFHALVEPGDLPWSEPWSTRDLKAAWDRPASFALAEIFGAEPSASGEGAGFHRRENWAVGGLVHRWIRIAAGAGRHSRQIEPANWRSESLARLDDARRETERALAGSGAAAGRGKIAPWWRGTLEKAYWAARRCVEGIAQCLPPAAANPAAPCFLVRPFLETRIPTLSGALRVRLSTDIMLLDRAAVSGAACQIMDIRTGTSNAAISMAGLERGEGIEMAALLVASIEEGARADRTHAGIVHPDSGAPSFIPSGAVALIRPILEQLARRQSSLAFGQGKAAVGSRRGQNAVEAMPLATTPIDGGILEEKMAAMNDNQPALAGAWPPPLRA